MRLIIALGFFLFTTALTVSSTYGQTPLFGFHLGGGTDDISYVTRVAPNGNVCIAGKFSGTMDLDPGVGVHNITSNGFDDIFLACYTPTGALLWGFNIGGTSYDGGLTLATDASSNVILGGYFRGTNVDFDPGAGTAYLSDAGTIGASITYDGDGFVAKYSSTGAYMWAKDLGGSTVFDCTNSVAVDALQNVYVCGTYTGTMVVSGAITFNSMVTGKCYIIKYNPAGIVIWGKSFGLPGFGADDTQPKSMQVSGGSIYVCGRLQGTSNFNPAGSAMLTSSGLYDGWFGRYDTTGNYVFANAITGTGSADEAIALTLDTSANIYLTGSTNSTNLTFDAGAVATSTVSSPGGGTNADVFLARYNSSGAYQWGKIVGGPGNDIGNGIDEFNGYIYCTGQFQNSVDFDPGAGVATLTSHGGFDIFITRYDVSGNYICGFNTGSATDDIGWSLTHDTLNNLYASGQFTGTNVDFAPDTTTLNLSSNGGADAYLVKYRWVNDSLMIGYLTADTICQGQPAFLTLHILSGSTGLYSMTLFNGSTSSTLTGIIPGSPFLVSAALPATTTYTVTSAVPAGANMCIMPPATVLGSATVVVHPVPIGITDTAINCSSVYLAGLVGDTSYTWSFGDDTTGATVSGNPVTHTFADTGSYMVHLTIVDPNGCTAADSLHFTVSALPVVHIGNDTALCAGSFIIRSLLNYPSGATYLWSNGGTADSVIATVSGNYILRVHYGLCSATDTMHLGLLPIPHVHFGNDTSICSAQPLVFNETEPAGSVFIWSTGGTGNTLSVSTGGTYWLTVADSGCVASDTINVTVVTSPAVNLGPDIPGMCQSQPVILSSSDTYTGAVSYLWNTGTTTPSLTVSASGSYWLTVSQNGCSASDSVNINFIPLPYVNLGNDTFFCSGTSITLTSPQPAGAQYLWSDGSTGTSLFVTNPGIYGLQMTNNGCSFEDTIIIALVKVPSINLGPDSTVCDGFIYNLLVDGDQAQYTWSTGNKTNSIEVTGAGTYWCTITNVCGTASDTVNLNYHFCNLWIPSAFTPNGDGRNDIFRVGGSTDGYSDFKMTILNRWGEVVFTGNDMSTGWDGTFNGVKQEIAVYYYMITYTLNGKGGFLKGDVQLIR